MSSAAQYLDATASLLGLPVSGCASPTWSGTQLSLPWPDPCLEALYLPIVWTKSGPLYGEAIGAAGVAYIQPWDLSDPQRQVLYATAWQVLQGHSGWGVYLLKLLPRDLGTWAAELLPMPQDAALVSTLVQSPNLFQAHCYASQGLPVADIQVEKQGITHLVTVDPATVLYWPGLIWYPGWIGCWEYPPPTDCKEHPFGELFSHFGRLG